MAIDLQKIQDSPHLLDILLQMEDVLDSLDIYVFKNWYLGEVVEGPVVKRYWLNFTLKYPLDKMPDPKAALRLLKHNIRVDFWKAKLDHKGEYVDSENPSQPDEKMEEGEPDDTANLGGPNGMSMADPAMQNSSDNEVVASEENPNDTVWLVRLSIPRRLVAQMSSEEMDFYDDDIDAEDVEDAKDTGIDDESAYMADEGAAAAGGDPMATGGAGGMGTTPGAVPPPPGGPQ